MKKNRLFKRKPLLLIVFVFLISGLVFSLSFLQQPQENRTQAAKSATLYITPNASQSSPIQKSVNEIQ
jgi:hypothetical protein